MRKKNVTISDIAEKTGYSKTTVSFAFNWPNRISAEAVERIMQCANELGYQGGNDILQDSANRYKSICVLVPEFKSTNPVPIWANPMYHLYLQCANHGFMFSLIDQRRSADAFFAKYSAVDAFMVLDSGVEPSFLEIAKKRHIPVVSVNLNVSGDDEEEKKQKRIDNAQQCLWMLFSLIRNGELTTMPSEDAYTFFSKNN